ncbi:MAG: endo-1,4-beta-xylanase [Armatimonadota bacterium]|nr:endo-1,4-beta-xylanase [bacterium]MDW8321762.1 endo-1,4-beta-xylanase [Armatimonadota bacterium]
MGYAASSVPSAGGVEKYRKGEAVLTFRLPDGSPATDVPVSIEQQSHDFLFGVPLRPSHYRDERTLQHVRELFNFVELLEFNWGQYEPDEGKPLSEERRRFIHEWCLPNGVQHFYGHMLVWSRQYGEYPKTAQPLWLFQYDSATQYELLRRRIQREVRHYCDVNMIWDVVNEPIHCRVWGEWDKPEDLREPLERVFPYVADSLRWAHEANPQACLLINEYDLFADANARERFLQLLQMLLEKDVPLHAVGIQAHDWTATYWPSPEELWQACEAFGTQLGLPIYFTELAYSSSPESAIRGDYQDGTWNLQKQADAVEEFYRTVFGHPQVAGIIYFGLAGSEIWLPEVGLLDNDGNPRPAWQRLHRLLREEWRTVQSGRTDKNGQVRLRAFFGRYQVEAAHHGRKQLFHFHLQKGEQQQTEFTLTP